MNDRGVSVEFIKENMSFTTCSEDQHSVLMFTMPSAFAQFERSPSGKGKGNGLQGQEASAKRRENCATARTSRNRC
jgi:hypothetical protein